MHRYDPRLVLALAAAALPSLLAWNVSPSPTFLNQALAIGLWGAWVTVSGLRWPGRDALPLWAALALLGAAASWSWLHGGLPASLGLSAIAMVCAAAVLVAAGAAARSSGDRDRLFAAFCWAWVAAGVVNFAIAVVQVFLPGWPDGEWIAASAIPGRAVGNLRQPNHLSSLLLWSSIGVVALVELRRLALRAGWVLLAAMVFAVVLTASRTGLVSVALLALWGVLDRRLSRPVRGMLLVAPLLYAAAWLGMAQWASTSEHTFGGAQRLAESDISSSRFGIWNNTLALIRAQPWTGVGFGEFNLAWTLTPFPGRPVAFFDHTHNLPLQLAVELGLPLAAAVIALLLWALARGAQNARSAPGDTGTGQRCAMVMVLMIGLHSLLEYPLWYSYFLLPAAWAWGYALQGPGERGVLGRVPAPALAWAGIALVAGAAYSVYDYARVVAIFTVSPGAPPLEQRIAIGQRSIFFAHHADYAAVTSGGTPPDPAHAFDRASHYLLDTRLMEAWARSLAERGELDAARALAARLREFKKPDAEEFFAPCPEAAAPATGSGAGGAARPFQCELPAREPGWRAYLPHLH